MPAVDSIGQLLNTMADRAIMPFSRYINVPIACRQLEGPTTTKPFKEINQFRPEAGEVADIVPAANLPTVDKAEGANVRLPIDRFKGISFTLDDKDYSELTRLGDMVAPAVLQESVEKLALYINNDIVTRAFDHGITFSDTTTSQLFSSQGNFDTRFLQGSFQQLIENHAPMDMHFITNARAYTHLLALEEFIHANKRGPEGSEAIRTGLMAPAYGTEFMVQPGLLDRNNAAWTSSMRPTIDNTSGYAAGATVLHLDNLVPAVGNHFTHNSNVHTITKVENVTGTDSDVTIFPALTATIANNAALSKFRVQYPNLHIAKNSIAFASGIVSPVSFRNMRGAVRQAVRREPRSGIYLMLNHFEGYFQELYVLSAWWGSTVDRHDGVRALNG